MDLVSFKSDRYGLVRLLFCFVALSAAAQDAPTDAGDTDRPVQVFILSGQSNMTGRGALGDLREPTQEQAATLARYVMQDENRDRLSFLYDGPNTSENGWTIRGDVFITIGAWPRVAEGEEGYSPWDKHGAFGPYYGGRRNNGFGPELAIGHMLGNHYDETVVLIKIAYGGNSLAGNFRPPSAGGELGDKYPRVVESVQTALANLDQIVPGYTDERGYELVGFFWNQGLSDILDPQASEYESNMAHFINDIRRDLDAPGLPFVIGVTGNWGWELTELRNADISQDQRDAFVAGITEVVRAQHAIPQRPEFAGNVASAETRDFWRPREEHGGRGTETHWMANGESYWLIGEAMGHAMFELLELSPDE